MYSLHFPSSNKLFGGKFLFSIYQKYSESEKKLFCSYLAKDFVSRVEKLLNAFQLATAEDYSLLIRNYLCESGYPEYPLEKIVVLKELKNIILSLEEYRSWNKDPLFEQMGLKKNFEDLQKKNYHFYSGLN